MTNHPSSRPESQAPSGNAARTWRRDEIRLGMILTKDGLDDGEPLLYKVVAIIDSPVAVIAPLYERDGDEREYHVISSPLFAKYHEVRAGDSPGAFVIDYGTRS